jgi:D-alanyl-D-alanine carboxypeptidase
VTGLVAVVLSLIVLVVVVAHDGSGGPGGLAVDPTGQATRPAGDSTAPSQATSTPAASPTPAAPTAADPSHDTSPIVACGDVLAPLDKQHRLAPDCAPPDLQQLPGSISAEGAQYLRHETAAAIQDLFDAARADGYQLFVNSSYRSYQNQVDTYNYWLNVNGKEYADRTSAWPGHSEHQLGTTADVGTQGHFLEAFTGTPAAGWLAANSWKYGFIVSYPDGKEQITGYAPEAWHIRYVGKDTAKRVHDSGLTLHEFLLR